MIYYVVMLLQLKSSINKNIKHLMLKRDNLFHKYCNFVQSEIKEIFHVDFKKS